MSTVEIGCAPGGIRPPQYLEMMCKQLNMPLSMFLQTSAVFGDFEWKVDPKYEETYDSKKEEVKHWLTDLYHTAGNVRYASW
jgi:hypothetical protein